MDTLSRLQQLMDAHGWSKYRLAKNSGLSQSTISNVFDRGSSPSIPTLEAICEAFGITLSQFFADYEIMELSPALKELMEYWIPLTNDQKLAILQVAKAMNHK